MSKLVKGVLTAFLGAALTAAPILGAPAQADPNQPYIYNTPGQHHFNGRDWFTSCEMYSSDVVRCRTDIWGDYTEYVDGAHQSKKGWNFNNLTYLPSAKSRWAGNNLARTTVEWTSGGRKWRTECDTAETGRGGCRSYVWTKQAGATVEYYANGDGVSGHGFTSSEGWVINNIVMFSSNAVPAVTQIPK